MNLKKILAAGLLTTSLTLGVAGVASAADGAPTTTRNRPAAANVAQRCERAKTLLTRLEQFEQRFDEHLAKLQAALAKAQGEGNTEAAAKIQARIDTLTERHQRLTERLEQLRERLGERCDGSASTGN